MNAVSLIARKRDGLSLRESEITWLVDGYVAGEVTDYQMAALAMAICIRGMNEDETAALTRAMLQSGAVLTRGDLPRVDKHSTGGVGDTVSLILAPLLACCDLHVPMISGRGLGTTGGTLDKLESIPGFRTDLSIPEIRAVCDEVGCVIAGASAEIAPADRNLYALRDVTATVPSIPLITSSILSKKLAEDLDVLVLDIKVGSGAFMKTASEARRLAVSLATVAEQLGVRTTAVLTDMSQPLGHAIGTTLEVDEAFDALRGNGPDDLRDVVLTLGAEVLLNADRVESRETGVRYLERHLASGAALERFERMVRAQGGDPAAPRQLASRSEVRVEQTGYVGEIATDQLGQLVIDLGGGRRVKTDRIDHSVGLKFLIQQGEHVTKGQPLAEVFVEDGALREQAADCLRRAVTIVDEPLATHECILGRIALSQSPHGNVDE